MVGDMETRVRHYHMDRRQISFVRFILEAYDNVAVLTTLDPQRAEVAITAAPGCEALVAGILDSLAVEVGLVRLDAEPSAAPLK